MFYPSILPMTDAEGIYCENVILRRFHFFSCNDYAHNIVTVRNEVVKVMFLQASVCPQGGWGVWISACWDTTPPWSRHPLEQTPPGADTHPPGADTPPQSRHPRSRHPPGADTPPPRADPLSRHIPQTDTPQSRHPPGSRHPGSRHPRPPLEQTPPTTPRADTPLGADTPWEQTPPRSRHLSPRNGHCCGRYASCWNAFLYF